jgi:hypothetical protein
VSDLLFDIPQEKSPAQQQLQACFFFEHAIQQDDRSDVSDSDGKIIAMIIATETKIRLSLPRRIMLQQSRDSYIPWASDIQAPRRGKTAKKKAGFSGPARRTEY